MQQQGLNPQQQAMMQQALYHHPSLFAGPQIEPILSGNLPPNFDSATCRSVYVGNIHPQVSEPLLQEVFLSTGPIEGCKLIKKDKSSYGFVHYFDRGSAALAIVTLNGRHLFGQPIKVNWAYASSQREDTSTHHNIFVGDLSPEVTDATLFACFSVYSSCSDARVMWDQKTGRSRGFGFVSFRNQQDAQSAINDLNGKWLGSRQIRCNWAAKGATSNDDNAKSIVDSNGPSALDHGIIFLQKKVKKNLMTILRRTILCIPLFMWATSLQRLHQLISTVISMPSEQELSKMSVSNETKVSVL
uniref:RRM domain-containing protein n=1 Tax=Gossypium raimondii TaxID=29730 RepID=A0A0D2LS05_GOSRA|nr:hypothetical protein B456_001G016600 [Gossypium raimondii]